MDNAVTCGQLRQIFPQIEPRIIERIVEEAKTTEGVDILTHCIEVVLARQEETTWFGDNIKDQQGNDDIVVVKSIRKETSGEGKTRDVPLVCVREVSSDLSENDSDSSNSESESSNNEDDIRMGFIDKNNFFEGSSSIMNEFYDRKIDKLIKDMRVPPAAIPAYEQLTGPAIQPNSKFPVHHHSATPYHQPLEIGGQHTITTNLHPTAAPKSQPVATPSPMLAKPNSPSTMPSSPIIVSVTNPPLDVIQQMYPKVNVDFVKKLFQQGYDLNGIVNMLIDRPDMQNSGSFSEEPAPSKEIDYFTEFSKLVPNVFYYRQCEALLRNEFQRVSVNDIRKALTMCNHHYAPARKLIEEALLEMNQNQRGKSAQSTTGQRMNVVQKNTSLITSSASLKEKFTIYRLLASKRTPTKIVDKICCELQLEIDFVKKQAMLNEEKKNAIYASHINKQQYVDEGELIECGCCFGEFPFEEIVQCSDGHLFCKECLHGYAKEIIFGSAMASAKLSCMGEDCEQPFPYNQLEKCLTKDEIDKYQSRLQEDCLAKVDIPNLHQCAFCEFAAIIPEEQKVFTCMNPKCLKEWCIECKEEWKDHFGKKCNEVEKKSETNLRLSYEERMTMAKVRKCAKCSLTFTKLDGCNKMTCRCGTTQCYVCRKSAINYDHFCRHPRDPGRKCKKCVACSLWTDPSEDDELAIKQLQEEATVAKRKLMEEIQQCANKKQKV